ncbi:hypothetical protein TKK_0017993 [Trichogramma kaykai]|uniref:Peptidase S1 domain-containing protein n=1 Tax=Trichogramma kaykai TaxID=54128 RepID=A0ABD2W0I2_9HYME
MQSIQTKYKVILNLVGLLLFLNPCHGQLRIIGGDVAKPGQFKYHVALETEKNRFYFCGGAIVSDWHIVTAAHCFVENGDFKWQDQRVQVVAGLFDLQKRDSAVIRRIDKVYVPTRYMYNTNLSDIALVRLEKPLGLATNPNLIALKAADAKLQLANKEAIVTGFGYNKIELIPLEDGFDEIGGSDKKLRYGVTQIFSRSMCKKIYEAAMEPSPPLGVICAKMRQRDQNKDEGVCSGDSGSPLVYQGTKLIGVVSANQENCTDAYVPTMYTRITTHLRFLSSALKDLESRKIRTFTYSSQYSSIETQEASVMKDLESEETSTNPSQLSPAETNEESVLKDLESEKNYTSGYSSQFSPIETEELSVLKALESEETSTDSSQLSTTETNEDSASTEVDSEENSTYSSQLSLIETEEASVLKDLEGEENQTSTYSSELSTIESNEASDFKDLESEENQTSSYTSEFTTLENEETSALNDLESEKNQTSRYSLQFSPIESNEV